MTTNDLGKLIVVLAFILMANPLHFAKGNRIYQLQLDYYFKWLKTHKVETSITIHRYFSIPFPML